jgi:hypothetical protein
MSAKEQELLENARRAVRLMGSMKRAAVDGAAIADARIVSLYKWRLERGIRNPPPTAPRAA